MSRQSQIIKSARKLPSASNALTEEVSLVKSVPSLFPMDPKDTKDITLVPTESSANVESDKVWDWTDTDRGGVTYEDDCHDCD